MTPLQKENVIYPNWHKDATETLKRITSHLNLRTMTKAHNPEVVEKLITFLVTEMKQLSTDDKLIVFEEVKNQLINEATNKAERAETDAQTLRSEAQELNRLFNNHNRRATKQI